MDYTPFGALRQIEAARFEGATRHEARFATDVGPLRIEAYAEGILRLRLGQTSGPDYGLLASPAPPPGEITCAPRGGGHRVEVGALAIEIFERPCRFRFLREHWPLLESATDGHIRGGLRLPCFAVRDDPEPSASLASFALHAGDAVYGLGEKYGPLNRRGQRVTSWNEDAWGVNAEASYKNMPFAWSPRGWGVFVHTPARVVHGVGYPEWSHRAYVLCVEEPALDLFLLAAPTPAGLLERFTRLTGRSPLPPRWSFGTWMSRAYYRTAEEALEVARMLREQRIPCDVLVLDGRAWLKVETRFAFEWDAERYPDPSVFVRELETLGFRLCLWEYPYISVHHALFADLAERGFLLLNQQGDPYIYEWDPERFGTLLTPLPPSGLIDFTNPEAYAWYRDAHRPLFEVGADAMKADFGEQVPAAARAYNGDPGSRLHNVYPLLFNRCVYEAAGQYASGDAVVWGRSGWTGSQRYPVQWGGDPQADWEGLAASIRGALSWGMSGGPFYSHDIGGFYGKQPDPELYVRWTQAGVMGSHTRFHGTTPREPWHFGDEALRIVRAWLEWRYRLLPYLQACAVAAHETGLPVLRAMPLEFPHDPLAAAIDEQYMFGPAMLVAPVVEAGGAVSVYLPPGEWFDLSGEPVSAEPNRSGAGDRQRIVGGQVIERVMALDRIPLYGREGGLVPLGPVAQHTGELNPEGLISELLVCDLPRADRFPRGLGLQMEAGEGWVRVGSIPEAARIRAWGNVTVHRQGAVAEFRQRR